MANSTIELTYTKDVYSKPVANKGLYKVTRIVNSLNYRPGDYLEEAEVETLCKGSRFTVTIK
jgi:ribosomal protein S17